MIASFTQTYSDNRTVLFEFHNKDHTDIYFRNKLDINYYAFHNSPSEYVQNILEYPYFKSLNNIHYIYYNNITYTKSFFETLQKLKMDGVKYMCFLQDDVFSQVGKEFIDELLFFVKNNTFDMLNIEVSFSKDDTEKPYIYCGNQLIIYETTSEDFSNKQLWAFDDGPYIANIDFLLECVYDDVYFAKECIWGAECYINEKIYQNKIQRLSCNIVSFHRVSIVGPNPTRIETDTQLLHDRFSLL